MIDLFFGALYSILSFAYDVLIRALMWGLAWVVLVVIGIAAFAIIVKPIACALGLVHPKYERLKALKLFLTNVDGWYKACLIFMAVVTFPLFVMSTDTTIDGIRKQINEHKTHEVVDSEELRSYKLLAVSNPKNVYVRIEDTKSGNTYQEYVGAYCNGKNRLGDVYNVEVTIYHMSNDPDSRFIKFHNLNRAFCS